MILLGITSSSIQFVFVIFLSHSLLTGRFYTHRECARLQGFPDSYRLDTPRMYASLGNAVSPPIIALLGAALVCALEGSVLVTSDLRAGIELLSESAGADAEEINAFLDGSRTFFTYSGCGDTLGALELRRLLALLQSGLQHAQRLALQDIAHVTNSSAHVGILCDDVELVDQVLEQLLTIVSCPSSSTEFRRLAILTCFRLVSKHQFAKRMVPFADQLRVASAAFEQHELANDLNEIHNSIMQARLV